MHKYRDINCFMKSVAKEFDRYMSVFSGVPGGEQTFWSPAADDALPTRGKNSSPEQHDRPTHISSIAKNKTLRQRFADRGRVASETAIRHVNRTLLHSQPGPAGVYSLPSASASTGGGLTFDGVPSAAVRSLMADATGAAVSKVDRDAKTFSLSGGTVTADQADVIRAEHDPERKVCRLTGAAVTSDDYVVYDIDRTREGDARLRLRDPVQCCDPDTFKNTSTEACLNRRYLQVRDIVRESAPKAQGRVRVLEDGDSGQTTTAYEYTNVPREACLGLDARGTYTPPAADRLDAYAVHPPLGRDDAFEDLYVTDEAKKAVQSRRARAVMTTVCIVVLVLVVVLLIVYLLYTYYGSRPTTTTPSPPKLSGGGNGGGTRPPAVITNTPANAPVQNTAAPMNVPVNMPVDAAVAASATNGPPSQPLQLLRSLEAKLDALINQSELGR